MSIASPFSKSCHSADDALPSAVFSLQLARTDEIAAHTRSLSAPTLTASICNLSLNSPKTGPIVGIERAAYRTLA